jgi:hypothetical protein
MSPAAIRLGQEEKQAVTDNKWVGDVRGTGWAESNGLGFRANHKGICRFGGSKTTKIGFRGGRGSAWIGVDWKAQFGNLKVN